MKRGKMRQRRRRRRRDEKENEGNIFSEEALSHGICIACP